MTVLKSFEHVTTNPLELSLAEADRCFKTCGRCRPSTAASEHLTRGDVPSRLVLEIASD